MKDTVQAIPTTYRGVKMRSRLEADTAATLDSLHIAWSYESLAVRFGPVMYLPDFYLPAQHVWVEAKGPHDIRLDKPRRLAEAFDADPFGHRTPLVVVVRPATGGKLTFEGAGDSTIALTFCHRCEHYTWADLAAAWSCRACWLARTPPTPPRPHDTYRSGDLPWVRAPRGAA